MSTNDVLCTQCQTQFMDNALYCAHCGHPKVRSNAVDSLIGQVLDARYSILAQIGQGASGTVYRAEHVVLGRKVAVKVLHLELSRDEMALERFRREATTVAGIENEHIVQINDIGRTADGRLYFAMELVEGQTLDALLLQSRTLDIKRTAEILIQIADALTEAHRIGYVHRDIRPRNILLSQRRRFSDFVKLLDFGLAKLVDSDQQAASTTLGMTFGDPRYMSPEQARGDRIDLRSDIYQLGCVAYEMLTGQPPFDGHQVFDILTKQVEQVPAPLPSHRPDVPLWMEATVTRMLTKRADDRFGSMSRLAQALQMGMETGEVMDGDVARTSESPASIPVATPAMGVVVTSAEQIASEPILLQKTVIGRPALDLASVQPAQNAALIAPIAHSPFAPSHLSQRPASAMTKTLASANPVASAQMPAAPDLTPATAAIPLQPSAMAHAHAKAIATVDPSSVSNLWFADPNAEFSDDTSEEDGPRKYRGRRKSKDNESSSSLDFEAPRRKKFGWLIGAAVLALGGGAAAWVMTSSAASSTNREVAAPLPVIAVIPPIAFDAAPVLDAALPAVAVVSAKPDAKLAPVANPVAITPSKEPTPKAPATNSALEKSKPGKTVRVPDPRSGKNTDPKDEEDSLLARRPGGSPPVSPPPPANRPPPPTTPSVGGADQTLDPYNAPPATVITTNADDAPDSPGSASPGPAASINAKAESNTLAFQGEQARDAGDIAAAASLFRKSLALNPRNLNAAMGLGQIASDQGQFEDATSHFRKATRIAPNSAIAHMRLGESLLNAGNREGAAKAFEKALKIDPDNARARDGFAEATQ